MDFTKKAATKSTSTKLSAKSTATKSTAAKSTAAKLSAKKTATKSRAAKQIIKKTATKSTAAKKTATKLSVPPNYLNTKLFIDKYLKSKKLIKIDKNTYFINKPKYGGVLRDDIVLRSTDLAPGAHPRPIRAVGNPPANFINFLIDRISYIFGVVNDVDRQVYLEIASPTNPPNPADVVLNRLYNSVRNQYPSLYILVVIERTGPGDKKVVLIKLCGGPQGVITRDFGHLSLIVRDDGSQSNPHFTFNRTNPLAGNSETMRLYFNYDYNLRRNFSMSIFGEIIALNAHHLSALHASHDLNATDGIPANYYLSDPESTFVSDLMWLVARYFRNRINNFIDPMRTFRLTYVRNAGTVPAHPINGNNLTANPANPHPVFPNRPPVAPNNVVGQTNVRTLRIDYYGGKNK